LIREGRQLPPKVTDRIKILIDRVSNDTDILGVLAFGSLATGDLKPLSDLDFGIFVSNELDKEQRFEKHLELIGIFTETFGTDEIDLVMLNDAPVRFAHKIMASGKLLYCGNRSELISFLEKTTKLYLDFKFFRDEFDRVFLKGIGYHG
jgi:predicted nucleotidyltransferase